MLSGWLSGKEYACHAGHAGDLSLVSGSVRSPGVGNGMPLQYFSLGNPMDTGAWGAPQSKGSQRTTEQAHRQEGDICALPVTANNWFLYFSWFLQWRNQYRKASWVIFVS